MIGIAVTVALLAAFVFVVVNERHLPKWVTNSFMVILFVICIGRLIHFGVRYYQKTHEIPATATVWFPDVPAKDIGESTARLAIIAGSERAVTVICPKWFDPDTGRTYTADNFKLETGDGRFTPIVWELRVAKTSTK